jgi:antitoxin component of RelBE/YafQ-DinJ toxin-antitoxin module
MADEESKDEQPKRERKEKVLHTRIPESLESEIKDRANRLGVSVSNLVRNVLHNTFGMINEVVADSQTIAKNAKSVAAIRHEHVGDKPPEVIGWQPLKLNVNAVCDNCNEILPKGADANVSVLDGPGKPVFRCAGCIEELTQ